MRRRMSNLMRYLAVVILTMSTYLLLSQPSWSLQEMYCPVPVEETCPPVSARELSAHSTAPPTTHRPRMPPAAWAHAETLPPYVDTNPQTFLDVEHGDYLRKVYDFLRELRQLSESNASFSKKQTIKRLINGSLAILKRLLDKELLRDVVTTERTREVRNDTEIAERMRELGLCPEVYKGSTYGYPFFYKGFEIEQCDHERPLSAIITAVLCLVDYDAVDLLHVMHSFVEAYPGVEQVVIITVQQETAELRAQLPEEVVHLEILGTGGRLGEAWISAIDQVKTPYLLAAYQLDVADQNMRLERLVRASVLLDSPVVGGAIRSPDGHWQMACQQSAFRNYTLVYRDGYHSSAQECVFCQYTDSPLVISTQFAQRHPFNQFMDVNHLVFADFFMHLSARGHQISVCPDSMFRIKSDLSTVFPREAYLPFVRRWNINHLVLSNGKQYSYTCEESGVSRGVVTGALVAPCSLEHLSRAIHTFMLGCEHINITCELQEGTLLGAVKMNKILPWERDADITILSSDIEKLIKNRPLFKQAGLNLDVMKLTRCCDENRTTGGVLRTNYHGWSVEIWGQHKMDSESGLATRVLLDGMWVKVPNNPGLYVRNRYGREVYRHAEHWMDTGKTSGWSTYDTSAPFTRCAKPGQHYCLNQYKTDGNIQFQDPLP